MHIGIPRSRNLQRALVATRAGALLCACVSLPMSAVNAAPFDPGRDLDPEYWPLVQSLQKQMDAAPKLSGDTLGAMRAAFPAPPPAASPPWSERRIRGAGKAPDVRIYIVNAGRKGAGKPAILHLHGGGFVLGSARHTIAQLQDLAAELDCVIVAVDYRLAPETPFPGSLNDNYAALEWLHDNADEIGADASRIALMGESAGGGHAAALAIAVRDRKELSVALQVLVYPMLDDRTGSTRRVAPHIGTLFWGEAENRFGWSSLLGKPAGSTDVPYGAVPARVENLAGLAPAFIAVGGLDLFVDENLDYARHLTSAGVPTA